MSWFLIAAAIVAAVVSYKLIQRLRFKLPPGPRPKPIVGNLYDIKPVRFRCYYEWAQSYGPIISVWIGSILNVVVSSAELAKEVLKEHDQKLADRHRNRSTEAFSRNGQDLIWADYGPHYVKVRKVCTLELFTPKRLESLRPIREDEVTAMVESVFRDCNLPENRAKGLQLRKYLGAVAFNNITRLAFGKRFVNAEGVMDEQGLEFKAIVSNGLKLGASLSIAEHIPWLRWMFPADEKAFAKHGARRDLLTRAIMEEHTLARQKSSGVKQHFVDALLTLKDQYDLSEDTIIGLLWDMITAGMDTTAITAEWAMAEMIKNPRVQQKVQEEFDRVVGLDRIVTEPDFSRLPYLQCVVKESFRLHPPTPLMLPHRANADVKIGGYNIPKGSNVHVNVWAVARDPAVWKNPLEFRPERFLEEDVDMKGHDFRLLPFGAGRRVCPGAQLGINLVTSMMSHLLHHFVWTPPQGTKPEEIDMSENPGLVTYMRTPVQAVATPRLPSDLYKRVPFEIPDLEAKLSKPLNLADFGLAEYKKNLCEVNLQNWRSSGKPTGGFHKKNMVGTLIYMAPEILKKEMYTEKSDIYSFGILINELLTGVVPYTDLRAEAQAHTVLEMNYTEQQLTTVIVSSGLRPALAEIGLHFPKSLLSLIQKCWEADPSKRPSSDNVVLELESIWEQERGKQHGHLLEKTSNYKSDKDGDSITNTGDYRNTINWSSQGEYLSKKSSLSTVSNVKLWSTSTDDPSSYAPIISCGSFATCGRRESMEDTHFLMPHMCNEENIHLFAIFDGHRGAAAAEFSAHVLPGLVRSSSSQSAGEALSQAFVRTDLAFRHELDSHRQSKRVSQKDWHPGCTAIASLIVENQLFVANVGDSRAILCRTGHPFALSKAHLATCIEERTRVIGEGGRIEWLVDTWRVAPAGLQVTRSIGDDDLKPAVTAEPEISETILSADDEFLVMASDGLWDVVNDEEVIGIIRDTVKEPSMCSKRLATEAAERGSGDNITVIVVFLRPVSTAERIY